MKLIDQVNSTMITFAEIFQQLATPLPTCVKPMASRAITSFVVDSRQVSSDCVFCAFEGQQFDGHDFIQQALDKGALLVIASKPLVAHQQVIIVNDVLTALARLATYWRRQLSAQIIAITGSNGKTSVKNLLKQVLSQNAVCVATQGNQNNEIGVPLTLLKVPLSADYVVLEMGARKLGDLRKLNQIATPDIALITNVESSDK